MAGLDCLQSSLGVHYAQRLGCSVKNVEGQRGSLIPRTLIVRSFGFEGLHKKRTAINNLLSPSIFTDKVRKNLLPD